MSINKKSLDCETLLYLARVSEQAGRHDEMAELLYEFTKKLARELSVEERSMLSVAYKNVVSARRSSFRVLQSIESVEKDSSHAHQMDIAAIYRKKVEKEIHGYCRQILEILDTKLIPNSSSGEALVFYFKMKGDYHRYLCEFMTDEQKEENSQKALRAYLEADRLSQIELISLNPIRLGLKLNFSVFYYEILQNKEEACKLASSVLEEANEYIVDFNEESFKDSALILEYIRDNLHLWNTE
ncbi:unnamed protein product [Blepharisma stoltei]|uniref:14-3-3 domain-containing protein n=1 Tax=Blepharisma stoltei TaxID=1481888 RepID=A0AAU9J2G9_9CILI|nr:unnamed protein product [Blepharisma stoltei]